MGPNIDRSIIDPGWYNLVGHNTVWQTPHKLALLTLYMQVLSLLAFITACAAAGELDLSDDIAEAYEVEDERDSARAAAGWIIFVGLVAMIFEGLVIALRFINFRLVNSNITVFLIVVCSPYPGYLSIAVTWLVVVGYFTDYM